MKTNQQEIFDIARREISSFCQLPEVLLPNSCFGLTLRTIGANHFIRNQWPGPNVMKLFTAVFYKCLLLASVL